MDLPPPLVEQQVLSEAVVVVGDVTLELAVRTAKWGKVQRKR